MKLFQTCTAHAYAICTGRSHSVMNKYTFQNSSGVTQFCKPYRKSKPEKSIHIIIPSTLPV